MAEQLIRGDDADDGRGTTAMALGAVALGALLAARAMRRPRFSFRDKVVGITGGSRGLGLVLARELAGEGAHLVLVARDPHELQRARQDLEERCPGVAVEPIVADIRDQRTAEAAINGAVRRFGTVDVVINNAGIIQVGPIDHMTVADFQDAMATHFWGPLYITLAVLPVMREAGGGRIVNIASIGGKIAVPHLLPYSASKFALVGLSDGLRAELAHDDIVVTTVCPGLMRTGSPINAGVKGQRPQEFAWFAISDSLPLATIDARRAARQILNACRRGDAELVITIQAKLAVLARAIAPELVADAMALMNRLLPDATGPTGNVTRPGRESASKWAPSPLTALSNVAARRNNEVPRPTTAQ